MARAKVGARNIVVGNVAYRWRATGTDGSISLSVWPANEIGPAISAAVSYNESWVPRADGSRSLSPKGQVVVTNRIVRRVIELATAEYGYNPARKGKPLHLANIKDQIDRSDGIRSLRWIDVGNFK